MLLRSICITMFLCWTGVAGNIYDIQFTTLQGTTRSMSDFQGKKLLIVVLPINAAAPDSSYLRRIDSVSRTFSDSVNVLGVPAFEYGFKDIDTASLRVYYRSILGSRITLTRGMYVKKTSGSLQHPLFSWLTNAAQNHQFDLDVKGVGQKYFISANGELYGNLSAAVTLRDSLMIKMLY